jgi:lysophospholipase L1-like esterase
MNKNYIIVGDSLTYGIGDYDNGGWASLFKKDIVSKDDSKVCSNYVHVAAFPGATSTIILNKIDSIYQAFKNDEFDNVVILSIGVNDTQEFNGSNKTSLEDYRKNIESIIKYVTKEAELIIVGLARIQSDDKFYWKPGKFYSNEILNRYDSELEKICQENNIKYIKTRDVLDKSDYIDGLHPNQIGHRKTYERIKEEI